MKTFKLDCDIGYETGDTWWGRQVGPDAVSDFLAGCNPGERVTIEINSAGGLCIPGFAIANSIKNSQAHVVAHVVGLAASMASVVMCACDEIQLEEGSFVMIHNPWSWAEGDAEELRKEAEVLDTMKAGIMAFYRAKFPGKSDEEISGLMDAETWMTGTDALRAGLKCVVIPTTARAAASATRHHFAKIPALAARFIDVKDRPPETAPNAGNPAEEQPVEEIISAASEASASSSPTPSDVGEPHSPEKGDSSPTTPAGDHSDDGGAGVAAASPQQEESALAHERAWEARLAGLQAAKDKELAEMSAKYKADIADMKARHEAAVADLQNQLQAKAQELESAKAEASSLTERLGTADAALADVRKQLADEIEQHRKLAGAALHQPTNDGATGAALIRCSFPGDRK